MSEDEWQAHVTFQCAMAMGAWLEARGRLERPIASLTRKDLECLAVAAITRFVVLNTMRGERACSSASAGLDAFLKG